MNKHKIEELNNCESKFAEWNITKAKDVAKLVSEETAVESQQQELSGQRESGRKEIARLELEQKMLVKKIIDTDSRRKKLVKKRKRFEDQADEKIYEHKIEKAKLQDSIQTMQFELCRVVETDFESSEKREMTDIKSDITNSLSKEIEEKERDLECPVCFELCVSPIYMCDLSHQICQHCRPTVQGEIQDTQAEAQREGGCW